MRTTRKLDLVLAGLGVLLGAPSLAWPFGWDTSVHYYVGREWLLRGALPYRDSFDHKPPAIHLLHALTIFVFGEGMWGIRVVELAAVAALGWACASLAAGGRRGRTVAAGLRGAMVLAASVLYYGFFEYWTTAQCELVAVTLATFGVLAAIRIRRPAAAALASGLLLGAAAAFKPPFALFALVAVACLGRRAAASHAERLGRRIARDVVVLSLGAAVVPAAFVAYFAAHGALGPLLDAVVYCNAVYLRDESSVHSLADIGSRIAAAWPYFCPLASILAAACGLAIAHALLTRSRDRLRRWGLAVAMFALGFAAVVVQLKFYIYHWTTCLPGVLLLVANGVLDLSRVVRPRRRAWVPAIAAAVLFAAYSRSGPQFDSWRRTTAAVIHRARGDWSRARYASTFVTWDKRRYADSEAAADWLRAHSTPSDYVLVRGVGADVYVLSGRRAPERFFWTLFLTRPSRRFKRDQWLAEDYEAIAEKKPRFVVAVASAPNGPDSVAWFRPLGYEERARFGEYAILERASSEPMRASSAR